MVIDAAWQALLAEEITPRFPYGLGNYQAQPAAGSPSIIFKPGWVSQNDGPIRSLASASRPNVGCQLSKDGRHLGIRCSLCQPYSFRPLQGIAPSQIHPPFQYADSPSTFERR